MQLGNMLLINSLTDDVIQRNAHFGLTSWKWLSPLVWRHEIDHLLLSDVMRRTITSIRRSSSFFFWVKRRTLGKPRELEWTTGLAQGQMSFERANERKKENPTLQHRLPWREYQLHHHSNNHHHEHHQQQRYVIIVQRDRATSWSYRVWQPYKLTVSLAAVLWNTSAITKVNDDSDLQTRSSVEGHGASLDSC